MNLITLHLVLREFRESDYEGLREIDGDPEVARYEHPVVSDLETHTRLAYFINDQPGVSPTHQRFAITTHSDDLVRGWITLKLNNSEIKEYEIGWTVRRADWGKGYAPEAAEEVLRYAFKDLNAHRVVALCHAENAASIRVMEKLGMRREGCLRETRWLNDAWCDELVYAILERDFPAR